MPIQEEIDNEVRGLIEKTNRMLAEAFENVRGAYKEPIAKDPYRPDAMAQRLARDFPTMRFIIQYNGNHQVVFAEPLPQIITFRSEIVSEYQREDVERTTQRLKDGTVWPMHARLCAFTDGYNAGAADTDHRRPMPFALFGG